jgi:hypothetical protein
MRKPANKTIKKPSKKPSTKKDTFRKGPFQTRKHKGEWVELLFMATVARLGLFVMHAFGDSARFDVIVETVFGPMRIQVKGTESFRNRRYSVHYGTGRNECRRYTAEQIDFLAVYVIPADAWYLIPARKIGKRGVIHLRPNIRTNSTKFERYREAWHLLMPPPGWRKK